VRTRQTLLVATASVGLVLGACGSPSSPPPEGSPSPAPSGSVAPTGTWAPTSPSPALPTTPPQTSPAAPASPTEPPTTAVEEFRSSISTVTSADLGSSWREGCPVSPEQLRAVDVSHWGYEGAVHTGRLIVAAAVADDVADIMEDLFQARFPIERMTPVDAFGADDDASMAANNTSAFNCRAITGGTEWSEHAYGQAIDVNPLVNPYVNGSVVLPPGGAGYVDRSLAAPGMIHAGDDVVRAFAARGWSWGGAWAKPIDYQHFSASGG